MVGRFLVFGIRLRRQDLLVLVEELLFPLFVVLVVGVLLRVGVFIFLRDDFDVSGIHLHVWRAVVEYGGRDDWHRVCQPAQFRDVMGKATVNAEFAMSGNLEVLAELRLIVAMKHSDELFAWETLWQWLKQSQCVGKLTSLRSRFSSEP